MRILASNRPSAVVCFRARSCYLIPINHAIFLVTNLLISFQYTVQYRLLTYETTNLQSLRQAGPHFVIQHFGNYHAESKIEHRDTAHYIPPLKRSRYAMATSVRQSVRFCVCSSAALIYSNSNSNSNDSDL